MRFTSKDFASTDATLSAETPERLIHRAVERTGKAAAFARERKHPVAVVDLPSRVISMTIGGLEPGQSTNRHRHTYETILYVLEGRGFTMVEDRRVDWEAGDAVYVPIWAWHQHTSTEEKGPCRYLACESAPLLQNLGAAIREEG